MGALELQMLATGLIDEGSSRVPMRTTVKPARPVFSAKRWVPQVAQNWRRTWLPLSAMLTYSLKLPVTSMQL